VKRSPFKGSLTALVTPFRGDEIDNGAFADLVEWQILHGADGLVACSLSGEGPTLSPEEHARLVRITVEVAARRIPVIAATGTNCTASTIALTAAAERSGVGAAIVVTPYYNRPNQEGLYRHFEAVARAVDIPIALHLVPARTQVELGPRTLERLARIPNIVGIIDETSSADSQLVGVDADDGLGRLNGRDSSAALMALTGAPAWVSNVANVAPAHCSTLQAACRNGQLADARFLHEKLKPLCAALDREGAPSAVKYAVSLLHPRIDPRPRLPIAPVTDETAASVRAAMANLMSCPAERLGGATSLISI
jgi:4-hydroxy-tetrahydrodipicolinate synthase